MFQWMIIAPFGVRQTENSVGVLEHLGIREHASGRREWTEVSDDGSNGGFAAFDARDSVAECDVGDENVDDGGRTQSLDLHAHRLDSYRPISSIRVMLWHSTERM